MLGDSKSWFLEVNNMRIEHVAMYVNDLEKEKAFFETYEVISGPRTTGDGYYESCILDPEGNQIEITTEVENNVCG